MAVGNKFTPLTLDLIEEGEFLKAFQEGISHAAKELIGYVEHLRFGEHLLRIDGHQLFIEHRSGGPVFAGERLADLGPQLGDAVEQDGGRLQLNGVRLDRAGGDPPVLGLGLCIG